MPSLEFFGLRFDHVVRPLTRHPSQGFEAGDRFLVLPLTDDPEATEVAAVCGLGDTFYTVDEAVGENPQRFLILNASRSRDRYAIAVYIDRCKISNPDRASFIESLLADYPNSWPAELGQHPEAK